MRAVTVGFTFGFILLAISADLHAVDRAFGADQDSPINPAFENCPSLIHHYRSLDLRQHASLEINLGAQEQTLNLVYDRGDDRYNFRDETYLIDAATHPGDGRLTGDTYSAECLPGKLLLTRVFAKFKGPLHSTFTLENGILTEQATMDGVPDWSIVLGKFEVL